ncbi:hemin-degrading factor [Pseudoduganella umbonata]|uniref:Hemin-degrading factor n=1 Tax=Pseudoduganella umbonata TaxID=864828 RepID=A0A4P8HS33_9BURK|nr:ChuX/HutX family heme-like substrate-binding protein [Pseudoduganella umbonata]MBB3224289.1 putative hemin transport protein [Pseudoduganella umbonata]QCP11330.1 hemin-degrading factor [Pseudoduganella umbonata]
MKTHRRYTSLLALSGALILGMASSHASTATLAERWNTLRAEQPKLGIRDAAKQLSVSEAELLATGIGKTATRLADSSSAPREIMRRALDLGKVMALTRNENGVIEVTGEATRIAKQGDDGAKDAEREARELNIAGGYLGGPIDLRFHFAKWKHAFAVVQPGKDGAVSRSLQFFDENGTAVHKVYLKDDGKVAVFDKLVADFRHPQQDGKLAIVPAAPKAVETPDASVDVKEFQQAWKDMSDVHQFNRIVSEFKLSREQALRLAPAGVATKVAPQAVRQLLEQAAAKGVPIMAFVGNGAVTQIYSGKVNKVQESAGYFNVLDPDFNLHLRDKALKAGYVLQRAGVTSVEFYDDKGELVVTFFGVRERGKPQPQPWLDLAAALPKA